MLGYVPEPELIAGQHLLQVLFAVGPSNGEVPLTEGDLEPWERRRGVELEPWEAECVVGMSRMYMQEAYLARESGYLCPWPRGQNVWQHARAVLDQQRVDENLRQPLKDNHGNRKRHRNPSPG